MEKVICDLCGANSPHPLFQRKDRFSSDVFQFVTCSNCGLVYLNPRPGQNEIQDYYPRDYEAYRPPEEMLPASEQWHTQQALGKQAACLRSFAGTSGRLLDIGCATGDFLNTVREMGWQVRGIELVENAAQTARSRYGLEVITGSLETVLLPEEFFEAITLWDVLEHLPSPKTALQRCHQLLKPGGWVIFSIPNIDSFDRYLFGDEWIGWDAPRHFNLFNQKTLERLLDSTGFRLAGKRSFLGAKGAFNLSLAQVIQDRSIQATVQKLNPLISTLLWPYRQLAYLFHRGPIITYAARKVEK